MNYCTIYKADHVNGQGLRVSLFVSGCTHHCPGCFNQKAWSETYGKPYTKETENTVIDYLKNPYIMGLTLLGGEPMEKTHQQCVWELIKRVREELPTRDIWLYSGYTLEQLQGDTVKTEYTDKILSNVDVLVDGEFVQELKDTDLAFRGSSNQRIIDMQKTLETGDVTLRMC
jgi:anaerobic ribonucleoside-triphosphate reductase activating protein